MEPTTRLFLAVIPICASTREYRKVICSYLRNLLVVNPDPEFSVSASEEESIAEGAVLDETLGKQTAVWTTWKSGMDSRSAEIVGPKQRRLYANMSPRRRLRYS